MSVIQRIGQWIWIVLAAVGGFELMMGWMTSTACWAWYLFHNWGVLATNGWVVATIWGWVIVNILWFLIGVFALFVGALMNSGDIGTVVAVFVVGFIQAVAVFAYIVFRFGW